MRVLILTSSTGGGHDMRAAAFATWTAGGTGAVPSPDLKRRRHGGRPSSAEMTAPMTPLEIETRIERPLENSHPLYLFGVGLYNWIQKRAPLLHHAYFNFLELTAPCGSARRLLGVQKFRKCLADFRPDVVLSVHGSLNHGYFELAQEYGARCVTYCGELSGGYGFSRHWVNPRADLFIGAVPETCAAAIRHGMPEEKTALGGFLLRPEFYQGESVPPPNEFTLLLAASSRGANNHLAFLEQLPVDVPVIVLCGHSTETNAQIESWKGKNSNRAVRVASAEGNIAQLLRQASAVVARPGTGITSEAFQCGCPLIFNCLGGAMPQEMITLKFCRAHAIAREVHSPNELSRIVRSWKNDPTEAAAIRERMRAVRPAQHPRDLLSVLASLGR